MPEQPEEYVPSQLEETLYSETRKDTLARMLSNTEALDKAVLSLSSAGLGLSLAFIKDVVSFDQAEYIGVLHWSWFLFAAAIVSTVASFLISQRGLKTQLKHAFLLYMKGEKEYLTKRIFSAKLTALVNFFSGVLFITAVAFTVFFVTMNTGGKQMAQGPIHRPGGEKPFTTILPPNLTGQKGANIPDLRPVVQVRPQQQGGPQGGGNQGGGNPQSSPGSGSQGESSGGKK